MAKRRSAEDMSGSTFADLYDIQEELNRQQTKPLGRPPKKIKRSPTTVHLTKEEKMMLNRLYLFMSEHLSINKSEIIGVAIEIMAELVSDRETENTMMAGVRSPEDIKTRLKNLVAQS